MRAPEVSASGLSADVKQGRNEESLGTYLGFGMCRPAHGTTLVMRGSGKSGPAFERSTENGRPSISFHLL